MRAPLRAGSRLTGLAMALLGCAAWSGGWAQGPAAPINPGAALQETQRAQERQLANDLPAPVTEPLIDGLPNRPKLKLRLPKDRAFTLKHITFTPSHFLSADALQAIAQAYLGRPVGLPELQRMVAAINALYDRKGVVTAGAILEPQRVSAGVLHVTLVESRVGGVKVAGNAYTHESFVRDRVRLPANETLDPAALDRAITYFNRTNEAQVRAALKPGDAFGLTNVDLLLQEPKRTEWRVFADNQGIDSTNTHEVGAYFRHNGLLGIQDRLMAFTALSRGSVNGYGSYDLPCNTTGGRLGVSYGQSAIKVVRGPFVGLNTRGSSSTAAINASQPIWVRAGWILLAEGAISDTRSRTTDAGAVASDDATDKVTGGASLSRLGKSYTVTLTQHVGGAMNKNIAEQRRRFLLWSGALNAWASLGGNFSLAGNAAWQSTAARALPADQLFQIGGPTTVRGYEANLLSGDTGYYADVELHRSLPELIAGLDTFGLVDRGHAAGQGLAGAGLTSAGAGASWTWNSRLTLELTVAWPLGPIALAHDDYRLYARVSWHIF